MIARRIKRTESPAAVAARTPRAWLAAVMLTLCLLSATTQTGAQQPDIRIAAAADLQPVVPSLIEAWQKSTGRHAEASYGSSATLTTQIENGAPFDLFLSADMGYPQQLAAKGLAQTPVAYARGTLVLWARKDSPVQPLSRDVAADLANPKLTKLAVANPSHAPYGRAAQAYLDKAGLNAKMSGRIVTAENIGQAAEFALSGNAQAGLISLTAAVTPAFQSAGNYVEAPRDYPPLLQGGSVLTKAAHPAIAASFLAFLNSSEGRAMLKARGLMPPD